jgi:SacI homology domain
MSQSPEEYRSDNEADARSPSGVVKLYIENDSFVFTQNSKALQLTFIDCEFKNLGEEWPSLKGGEHLYPLIRALLTQCLLVDTYEPPRDARPFEIYGILGIVNGAREKFLVIISSVQLRGHISGSPIYAIDKVVCLDLDHHRSYRRLANRAKDARLDSDIDIDVTDTESDDVSSNNDIPEIEVDTSATASVERPPVSSKNLGKGLVPIGRPTLQGARTNSFLNKMKHTFSSKSKVGSDTEADESKYDGAVDTPTAEKSEPDFQDYEDDVRLDKRMVKEVQALFSGQTFFFSPSFGKLVVLNKVDGCMLVLT